MEMDEQVLPNSSSNAYKTFSAQAEMEANVYMRFMHISVPIQLRLCLSPCPNVTGDLVFSIKNKILAHRLATLPFL